MSNISLGSDTEVVKYNGVECNAITLDGQVIWERPNFTPELPLLSWEKSNHWLQSSSEAPESWKLVYEYGEGLVSNLTGVGYKLIDYIFDDPIPQLPSGVTAFKSGTGLYINPGSRPYSDNLASFLLGAYGPDQWDWGFSLPSVYNHETYNTRLSTEQVQSDLVACVGGLAPSWAPFQGNGRNSNNPLVDFESFPSVWGNNPFNRSASGAINPDRSTWKISGNDVIVALNLKEEPRDNVENRFHELEFSTNYLHHTNNYQDQGLDYYSRSYPVEYLLKDATDITKGYYRKVTYATAVKARVDGGGTRTRYGPFSIKIELPTHEQLLDAGYGDFSKNGGFADNYVNYNRIIVPLFSHPDTSQELRSLDTPEPAANGLYMSGLSDIIGFNPFTLGAYKEADNNSSYDFPYDIGDGVKQIVSADKFYGRPYNSAFTSPYSSVQAPALWTGTLVGKYKNRDGATQTVTGTPVSFILNEAKIETSLSITSTGIKITIDDYLACSTYKYQVNGSAWSSAISVSTDTNIALSDTDFYTVNIEGFEGAQKVADDYNGIFYGDLPTISSWVLEEEDAVLTIKDLTMSDDADAYVFSWHTSTLGYSGVNENFSYIDPRSLGLGDFDVDEDVDISRFLRPDKNGSTTLNLQYTDSDGNSLGPTTISIKVYAAVKTSLASLPSGVEFSNYILKDGEVYAFNTTGIKKTQYISSSGDTGAGNLELAQSLNYGSFTMNVAGGRNSNDNWVKFTGSNGYINLNAGGRNRGYVNPRYDKNKTALNPWETYFNNPVLTTAGVANMKEIYQANNLGEYDENAFRVWYYGSFTHLGFNLYALWIAWIDEPKMGSNTVLSFMKNGNTPSSPFTGPSNLQHLNGWFYQGVPQITPNASNIINNTGGDYFGAGMGFRKTTTTIS